MGIARSMPRLIVFVGTVGSGKSTQMQLLGKWLRRKGVKTRVTVLKTNHLSSNLLTSVLVNVLLSAKERTFPIGMLIEHRPALLKKLLRLWFILDCFSVSLKFLWDVVLPLRMGRVVLVEEYLPAIVADYFYISKALDASPRIAISTIKRVSTILSSAGPMFVVFLDAQSNVLRKRWKMRSSPTEKAAYIKIQRGLLLECSKRISSADLLFVDTTTRTVVETQEYIRAYLDMRAEEQPD